LNYILGRCFEDGVDSSGNDIKDFRVSSIEECQNECKKLFSCKLFVYAPSNKNCWLKHTRLLPGLFTQTELLDQEFAQVSSFCKKKLSGS